MDAVQRYHALTQIFMATCNLDGDARRRELDRLCGPQPELRSEVELLLSFHDQIAPSSTPPPPNPAL